jgi:hypothetical protein
MFLSLPEVFNGTSNRSGNVFCYELVRVIAFTPLYVAFVLVSVVLRAVHNLLVAFVVASIINDNSWHLVSINTPWNSLAAGTPQCEVRD